MLGKGFALLPLGSVAFRVGLASAAEGALAAALVVLCGAAIARAVLRFLDREDPVVEAALGAAAGIVWGGCWAAAFQAVRPEVYALNALLLLLATHALLRFELERARPWLYVAALAVGLALANHHFLAALYALVAVPFVLARRRAAFAGGPGRALALVAVAGALGLALYAYLPLRALRHPLVDWGAPSTLARFAWTVSARAFQKSLAHARQFDAAGVGAALAGALGAWSIASALGAYLLLRLPSTRRSALLLLGGALSLATAPALVGFDPANPDAHGYLEPAVALLAIVGAAAPAIVLAWVRAPMLRRSIAAALVLAALVPAARDRASWSLTRFADTDRFASALLDEAPPRATLVTSYFQTVFALWYARAVEGARPDVDHLHRHFLAYPGMGAEAARDPSLAPLVGARDVDWAALDARAARRPVLVEYDLDLDDARLPRLLPLGLADRLLLEPPSPVRRREAEIAAGRRLAALTDRLDAREPQTLRALLWLDFLDAQRDCRLGDAGPARAAIDRARRLIGGAEDHDLEELARRCGTDRP